VSRIALVAALWVLGSGCATVQSLFGPKLPYDARVYLLDAEEDLMTAATRSDEAARELDRARRELDAAEDRQESLRESPLKKEAQAAVELAKARVARAEKSAELLFAAHACADRRYSAARAQAAVKFKVEGASASDADGLSAKAEECEARLDKRKEALAAAEEALQRARAEEDRAEAQAAVQAPQQYPRPWLE
jgi:hypothetical protein